MCVFKYHAFIFCMRPPRWRCETLTSINRIAFIFKYPKKNIFYLYTWMQKTILMHRLTVTWYTCIVQKIMLLVCRGRFLTLPFTFHLYFKNREIPLISIKKISSSFDKGHCVKLNLNCSLNFKISQCSEPQIVTVWFRDHSNSGEELN